MRVDEEHEVVVVGEDLAEDPSNEGCVILEETASIVVVDSIAVRLSAAREAAPVDQPIDDDGKLSSSSSSKLGISVK